MADLSISQIFQETIAEHERGVVNGVQNSLNSVMDIAKNILVIILPDPRTFGILIIISWLAVFIGYCFYCYFCRRVRGHLLPFHNQLKFFISKGQSSTALDVQIAQPAPQLEQSPIAVVDTSNLDRHDQPVDSSSTKPQFQDKEAQG